MFNHLFSHIDIGNLRLKNRIVMTAMHLNYTPHGEVTDRVIAFYRERARGGTALVIVGGCTIDEYSGGTTMINLREDRFIPGLRRLTDAIHADGAGAAAQLYHSGGSAHSILIGRQAIAPSAVVSGFSKEESRAMSKEDIQKTIQNYARAAGRARMAGFDAVEILSCSGYLFNQFLSSLTNMRTDEYGGSFENRMRFGLEVTDAVRKEVGGDFPLLVRLSGNDFIPGGNTNKEVCVFAAELEKHGIDAFNITGGWHESRVPQLTTEVPRGTFAYLARDVKERTSKPVITCNRVHNPAVADALIAEGSADMVGFARELLADPELPKKAQEGRPEEITFCLGCNQGCFDHIFALEPIECMVNPRCGHEHEIPEFKRSGRPKKVMVLGGGPAGLFAAKTAALSGHEVTLYEKSDHLGGQFRLAGALEDKSEFKLLIGSFTQQAVKAGVTIRTGMTGDIHRIREHRPDAVIVATGGGPVRPDIPGIEQGHVMQAWDVLRGTRDMGREVVVIGGGVVGVEIAISIAKIGTISAETFRFLFLSGAEDAETLRDYCIKGLKKVTIIEMLPRIAGDMGISTRWVALQMLRRYGVDVKTGARAEEITPEGVIVSRSGMTELVKCHTVILASGTQSVHPEGALDGYDGNITFIGDAKSPRKAYEAIREGFHAGRNL
ncbi:MAG: FAD-dependent oxidoreductase [Deltaproteobacteria bacterium]|nr:FAD-dependent oxidoreductase [Deltaproteobacteria bacterium]